MSTTPEPTPAQPSRLRLTSYAAAQLLLAIPALVFLVLTVVGAALLVVWVGVAFLAVTVPATRWIAERHRAMAARVLEVPVPRPYRPVPRGRPVEALLVVLRDPMTWRDLGWSVWASTFGFVVARDPARLKAELKRQREAGVAVVRPASAASGSTSRVPGPRWSPSRSIRYWPPGCRRRWPSMRTVRVSGWR